MCNYIFNCNIHSHFYRILLSLKIMSVLYIFIFLIVEVFFFLKHCYTTITLVFITVDCYLLMFVIVNGCSGYLTCDMGLYSLTFLFLELSYS